MARVAMLRSKCVAGVEPRLDREARALAEEGHEVHAILWDRDVAFPQTERRAGYTIHRVRLAAPYGRTSLLWKLPRWWRKAFALLKTLRPDVVHAADYDTVRPALRAKASWGAKFVFDVWDFYGDMITRRIPSPVRRWIARSEGRAVGRADLVILPDLARRARLLVEPARLIEVANVPEERRVVAHRHGRFHLFYAGNLANDRGLQSLVSACESTGADLVVAGQGPDQRAIVALLASSPAATFLGVIPHEQVLERTAGADVIPVLYDPAVPNNLFASPNKLFEAMMFGVPVVVSDGIGVADLVRETGIGLVVRYGDVAALSEAVRKLRESPDLRSELGRRGRALYEARFRWDVMKGRLVEGYRAMGVARP